MQLQQQILVLPSHGPEADSGAHCGLSIAPSMLLPMLWISGAVGNLEGAAQRGQDSGAGQWGQAFPAPACPGKRTGGGLIGE